MSVCLPTGQHGDEQKKIGSDKSLDVIFDQNKVILLEFSSKFGHRVCIRHLK